MWTFDFFKSVKSTEQRIAWAVALAADALQIGAFPIFIEGIFSGADDVLDVIVGLILCRLLGWHWAFLPTAAAKLVPVVDLFPTWTAAVFYVTRNQVEASTPEPGAVPGQARELDPREVRVHEPEILPPDRPKSASRK